MINKLRTLCYSVHYKPKHTTTTDAQVTKLPHTHIEWK